MYDDDIESHPSIKIPPHSIEAERSVLGGLMIANDAWYEIANVVKGDDFYRNDHRTIFRCMSSLVDHEQPIDIVTVAEHLHKSGELDGIGGMHYLRDLTSSTPSTANIAAYGKIVAERSRRRNVIGASHDLSSALLGDGDTESSLNKFLTAVDEDEKSAEQVSLREALTRAVEYTDQAYQKAKEGVIRGIPTGIERFDDKHGGLQDGHLYIIGARPSMGKTAVACNIMWGALQAGKRVGFMSLEMPSQDIAHRMISLAGSVPAERMRNGKLDDHDWPRLTSGVSLLNDKAMEIYDGDEDHINDLIHVAMRMKHRNKIDLLVIDYVQLIEGDGNSRTEELNQITRKLKKKIAKRLRIPVIALAQINREVEKRANKRPTKADLKDSGSIEQDADMVILLHREGYYDDTKADNTLEYIIDKNRHGPTGTIWCGWEGELMQITQRRHNEHDD
jgi:replicative DNA helicase